MYELKLKGICPHFAQSWASSFGSISQAMSLGFMLHKKDGRSNYNMSSSAKSRTGDPFMMMMAMMGNKDMLGGKKNDTI